MKKKFLYTWLSMFVVFSACAQPKPIRLIVRGDDMGYSHAGNEALVKAFQQGIETSIEVIVPSPWFPEAVKMLEANPKVDVGIHLALTSEWDNIKWRPLTACPSLRDADGYFLPMVFPNKSYPGRSIKESNWKLADIEKEFRAQIEMALRKIPRISHLSSHMGCTDLSDSVRQLTNKLAKEYHLDVDLAANGVKGAGYEGPSKTSSEKVKSFINMLNKLEEGGTYLFVDHPGLDSPELQAIHHIGYETVSTDRQGVVDAWTSPAVKEVVRKRNIQLIGYKDLKK